MDNAFFQFQRMQKVLRKIPDNLSKFASDERADWVVVVVVGTPTSRDKKLLKVKSSSISLGGITLRQLVLIMENGPHVGHRWDR